MRYSLILLAIFLLTSAAKAGSEPTFEKVKIKLQEKTVRVELADTELKREHGLMFRKSMPTEEGMLFVFDQEQQLNFWMRNTLIPLSIGYFTSTKKLIDIQEMVPASPMLLTPVLYPSKEPAKYALEMNKGWFAKNKIRLGATFVFVDSPSEKAPNKP